MKRRVWELLVPAYTPDGRAIPISTHKGWDAKVCQIAGGVTLYQSVLGRWASAGQTVSEKMIPVRVVCTDEQLDAVLSFTGSYYQQSEIMSWLVAEEVRVWRRPRFTSYHGGEAGSQSGEPFSHD